MAEEAAAREVPRGQWRPDGLTAGRIHMCLQREGDLVLIPPGYLVCALQWARRTGRDGAGRQEGGLSGSGRGCGRGRVISWLCTSVCVCMSGSIFVCRVMWCEGRWWHQTLQVEPTIALASQYANARNIHVVLAHISRWCGLASPISISVGVLGFLPSARTIHSFDSLLLTQAHPARTRARSR